MTGLWETVSTELHDCDKVQCSQQSRPRQYSNGMRPWAPSSLSVTDGVREGPAEGRWKPQGSTGGTQLGVIAFVIQIKETWALNP